MCSEEVQIAPQCNLLCTAKIAVRHGVMPSGHSTISLPCPALKPYKQRVHTMNEVIVLLWHWHGKNDDDINFFWWTAKTVAGSYKLHEGHDGRLAGLGSILDPNVNQDTIGKL